MVREPEALTHHMKPDDEVFRAAVEHPEDLSGGSWRDIGLGPEIADPCAWEGHWRPEPQPGELGHSWCAPLSDSNMLVISGHQPAAWPCLVEWWTLSHPS